MSSDQTYRQMILSQDTYMENDVVANVSSPKNNVIGQNDVKKAAENNNNNGLQKQLSKESNGNQGMLSVIYGKRVVDRFRSVEEN